jgi:cysteinyl-tRNA synthetase
MVIDSTRLTAHQNLHGLNRVVYSAKDTYYKTTEVWKETRQKKDYATSDKLRDILRDLEWSLLYWGEVSEKESLFNVDRLK